MFSGNLADVVGQLVQLAWRCRRRSPLRYSSSSRASDGTPEALASASTASAQAMGGSVSAKLAALSMAASRAWVSSRSTPDKVLGHDPGRGGLSLAQEGAKGVGSVPYYELIGIEAV